MAEQRFVKPQVESSSLSLSAIKGALAEWFMRRSEIPEIQVQFLKVPQINVKDMS
jgi:hypothetical protein